MMYLNRFLLFKFRFGNNQKLKKVDNYIKLIRNIGKEKILDRFKAFKNKDYIPNDILSSILHNWSKYID